MAAGDGTCGMDCTPVDATPRPHTGSLRNVPATRIEILMGNDGPSNLSETACAGTCGARVRELTSQRQRRCGPHARTREVSTSFSGLSHFCHCSRLWCILSDNPSRPYTSALKTWKSDASPSFHGFWSVSHCETCTAEDRLFVVPGTGVYSERTRAHGGPYSRTRRTVLLHTADPFAMRTSHAKFPKMVAYVIYRESF